MAFPPTKCCKRNSYCHTLDTHPRTIPSSHIHVALFGFLCFLIWKMNFFHMTPLTRIAKFNKALEVVEIRCLRITNTWFTQLRKLQFALVMLCWFFLSIIITFKSTSSFYNSPSTLS